MKESSYTFQIFELYKKLPIRTEFVLHASSGSMEPLIRKEDVLLVVREIPEKIRKGDILVFFAPNLQKIIAHRVVRKILKKKEWHFETQGDANPIPDFNITTKKYLLGRVTKITRRGEEIVPSRERLFFFSFDETSFFSIYEKLRNVIGCFLS